MNLMRLRRPCVCWFLLSFATQKHLSLFRSVGRRFLYAVFVLKSHYDPIHIYLLLLRAHLQFDLSPSLSFGLIKCIEGG